MGRPGRQVAMPLSDIQRADITRRLTAYCEARTPLHVRDRVRLAFRIGQHDVVLFEERPRFQRPKEWHEEAVAKFRYVAAHREWRLYCQYSDLKWHEYEPRFAAPDFETLLTEVDQDPTGIFWG